MPKTKKEQTPETFPEKKTATEKPLSGLQYSVYAKNGDQRTGQLPKTVFAVTAQPKLLAQYIRYYRANQRQGNAAAKTRGQVTGSTRKIYRQKGTGRARHGSIKAPIFVGGGIVGGPAPRDFSLDMNKKQRKKALLFTLHLKQKEHAVYGLDKEFVDIEPKTKLFALFLKKHHLADKKTLLVVPKVEKNNLLLAVRNIPNIRTIEAASLNAYAIAVSQTILFLEGSLEIMEKQI